MCVWPGYFSKIKLYIFIGKTTMIPQWPRKRVTSHSKGTYSCGPSTESVKKTKFRLKWGCLQWHLQGLPGDVVFRLRPEQSDNRPVIIRNHYALGSDTAEKLSSKRNWTPSSEAKLEKTQGTQLEEEAACVEKTQFVEAAATTWDVWGFVLRTAGNQCKARSRYHGHGFMVTHQENNTQPTLIRASCLSLRLPPRSGARDMHGWWALSWFEAVSPRSRSGGVWWVGQKRENQSEDALLVIYLLWAIALHPLRGHLQGAM